VGAALELLAVTTRNSGMGQVLSDQCLGRPETFSGNGRVVKKKLFRKYIYNKKLKL
jgi:hypothetical protein